MGWATVRRSRMAAKSSRSVGRLLRPSTRRICSMDEARANTRLPCVCQVQLLHRHGARYPTLNAGPAEFATKLKAAKGLKA